MDINATLIVELVTFLVFVVFTMTVIWPPLVKALEKRRALIAEGIASSEQSKQALAEAQKEGALLVAQAREQATVILRKAEERGNVLVEEASQKGKEGAERILSDARKEIESEVKLAKAALYQEIAGLTLKAAGQVVMEDLDDDKHRKLVGNIVKAWG